MTHNIRIIIKKEKKRRTTISGYENTVKEKISKQSKIIIETIIICQIMTTMNVGLNFDLNISLFAANLSQIR